ncbi:hormogonium polysaccharide biosynthesis glycosyltransferase HpsE [Spirulina sp. CS-785/01]|uniref:hormogonium polysaccharide biosynthesis glycosyltransferase HpsE n=1 Tax=Spirulina sp. CS-785/01 TaxID=3021716 RepID=UPI00232F51F1|nr:hormogonium polysaccharide biosynthesis glycosyltransferase HpsE [Spirulina sp. CS-785/01]MDB9314592.1 hormogonium polysaccharide biosynthesis glycosyltransferase HpsE [Spirulina sp. CS-785/01]
MSFDLTVAIPTYNGAGRLPQLLDCLKRQVETESLGWEVLVVDNNSRDNTLAVVEEYQQQWLADVPLRVCTETQQGAAFARIRGIHEAEGELVGFLDDDTLPKENWVSAACRFAREYPQAGAFGSQIHGEYETEPPEDFEKIASFFAITERGEIPHLYHPQMKMLPPSAGLVVRRRVWLEIVPERPFLTGRSQNSVLNSEDLEAILYIQNAGWEIWYNAEMELYHQIPRDRLTRAYLLYLVRSTGLARHHIRMLRYKPWQRPFLFPVGLANDIRKALFYFLKYRHRFQEDVVAACEMEFLRSSIVSPFYLWKQALKS